MRIPALLVTWELASAHPGEVGGDDALRLLQLRALGEVRLHPVSRRIPHRAHQVSEPIRTRLPLERVRGRNARMFCRPCSCQAYITRHPAPRSSF